MTLRVALVGQIPAGAESILAQEVTESMTFDPVPNPTDTERATSAIEAADAAVVDDWPSTVEDAPDIRLIQRWGAGVENFDRKELPAGAYVCNVYEHGPAIAEHVFMLAMALRRDLLIQDRALREDRWEPWDPSGNVKDLAGATMGSVGFGHIGRSLVDPAQGFDVELIAIQGSDPGEATPEGVAFLGGPDDLDRLLSDADILVIAASLSEQTRGLIGEREFDMMAEDAVLINVARGPIVAERALFEALSNGDIAGAGIDTWYHYPDNWEPCAPSAYPFHELDNVVMTPHASGWSERTARRRWSFIADNLDRVARSERPRNVVWEPNTDRS